MSRILQIRLAVCGLILLAAVAGTGCLTRMLLYPGSRLKASDPPAPPLIEVTGMGWAWDGDPKDGRAPALLFLHGNGETLETMRQSGAFEEMMALGCPFLAVEYPGYGGLNGSPSQKSLVGNAEKALEWLRERHPRRRVVLIGWSLGAAVAVQTASRHPVEGLICISPFSTLPDAAREHYASWLVWLLLRDSYDSLEAAKGIHCPSLVLHGDRDDLIPPAQGETLAVALGCSFVPVPGAGHNDTLFQCWKQIGQFARAAGR